MNIQDLERHLESTGCEVKEKDQFSLVADCDGIFFIKKPESRIKVLVHSNILENISDTLTPPKSIKPGEITIGKFSRQGSWSRILKLGNLDEVEFIYGEKELRKINNKAVKKSIDRIERANKFAYMSNHNGMNPISVIKKEVDNISNFLVNKIENKIASKTNNNVICGGKSSLQKSWNKMENERYRFIVKVNCKVPSMLDPVTTKIESIGEWSTHTESDRFYVHSVRPPSGDIFLTGIKVKSRHGEKQLEFEVRDDKTIKQDGFLKDVKEIESLDDVHGKLLPVDIDLINQQTGE